MISKNHSDILMKQRFLCLMYFYQLVSYAQKITCCFPIVVYPKQYHSLHLYNNSTNFPRYTICLILAFGLYELFTAFICTNNIGSMVNSFFWLRFLILFLFLFLFHHLLVVIHY